MNQPGTAPAVSLEMAEQVLLAYGYHYVTRFGHLHAVRYLQEVGSLGVREREGERHVCCLDELPSLRREEFLAAVERIFGTSSYTRTPFSLVERHRK